MAIGVLVEALLSGGGGAAAASGGGGGLHLKTRQAKKNRLGTNLKHWRRY